MPDPEPIQCAHCGRPITPGEPTEPYAYPSDGRRVHSACVGELLREVLEMMAAVPQHLRGDASEADD